MPELRAPGSRAYYALSIQTLLLLYKDPEVQIPAMKDCSFKYLKQRVNSLGTQTEVMLT